MTATRKQYINLPGRRGTLPFSDAVLVDDSLYISGRIGFRPGTNEVPEDASEEARYLMDGIRSVLEAAQMTMNDLVYIQIFCPDVSLFETFNAVYREYFSGDMPARAFLGSGPLLFGARFEMMAIAQRSK